MSDAPTSIWVRPGVGPGVDAVLWSDKPDAVRYVRADVYEEVMARNAYLEKTHAALMKQMREAASK